MINISNAISVLIYLVLEGRNKFSKHELQACASLYLHYIKVGKSLSQKMKLKTI